MATPATRWVPDIGDFATRLVLIRHRMGWNLKEAATACGVRPQSWREWELRARRPRDYEGVCKRIADRTGCDLIWLLIGDPDRYLPAAPAANGDGDGSTNLPVGWLVASPHLPAPLIPVSGAA